MTEKLRERSSKRFDSGFVPYPPVTSRLVFLLVWIHLATGVWDHARGRGDLLGIVFWFRDPRTLEEWGARARDRIADGEIWRVWTYGYLHHDSLHLLLNAFGLWALGRVCEAVFGGARTLWIFFVSVVGGGALSQLFGGPTAVGASGGVFGLMGALFTFGVIRRRAMPEDLLRVFTLYMLPFIVVNLVIGYFLPFIDQAGHVGGLLAGMLTGGLVGDMLTMERDLHRGRTLLMTWVPVVLSAAGFAAVAFTSMPLR